MSIEKAFRFATSRHAGQTRKYTGEPYIVHPFNVMERVRGFAGEHAGIVALLHDVPEDTDTTFREIAGTFGPLVAVDVFSLTKPNIKGNRATRKAAAVARIAAGSYHAKVVKVADRGDNLRSLHNAATWHAGARTFLPLYKAETLELIHALNVMERVSDAGVRRFLYVQYSLIQEVLDLCES